MFEFFEQEICVFVTINSKAPELSCFTSLIYAQEKIQPLLHVSHSYIVG